MSACLWPTTRRHSRLLALIILLGAGLRLWLLWRTPLHQPANDEVEYLTVARDLLAGRGWQFYARYSWLRAPLYPLWLAGSLWVAGGDLRWAALPNIALSSLTIYLCYLLGCAVGCTKMRLPERDQAASCNVHAALDAEEQVGVVTAALAAALLTLATFAGLWMAETLFTALFTAALVLLLRCADQPRFWLAGLAGIALGLAILVRSVPLTVLPLAALWLGWPRREPGWSIRHIFRTTSLRCAVWFVICALAVIAPWTLRNYLAYNTFIPVETGLSYNTWAFNEPREELDEIQRTLENIPNPAERADYATSKGLARLREDPAILLRKLWPNWIALWRVKPIQDRFLQPNYYEDIPFGMFITALLLDDALYALVAVLGVAGLLLAPLDRRKLLLGGWVVYVNVVIMLTHGEGRYRHFFFPILFAYAAWFCVALRQATWRRTAWRRAALAVAVAGALLWTPLALRYPWAWAQQNVQRGWAVQRAEWAAQSGDLARAVALQQAATQLDPGSPDAWLGLGLLYQRLAQDAAALDAFTTAFNREPSYVATNIRLGDALRRAGQIEAARQVFKGFYTDEIEMLNWAWQQLDTSPPAALAVGDGLDFGFIDGVYAAEAQLGRQARWTGATARLKLAGSPSSSVVRLTLAAPWPNGQPVPAVVCVDGRCQRVLLDNRWRTVALVAAPAAEHLVQITAPTFTPRQFDPQSPDLRRLGVLIDHASQTPLAAP